MLQLRGGHSVRLSVASTNSRYSRESKEDFEKMLKEMEYKRERRQSRRQSRQSRMWEKSGRELEPGYVNPYNRPYYPKSSDALELCVIEELPPGRHSVTESYLDEKAESVEGESTEDQPAYDYPPLPRLMALSVGLALIVFTVALDNTIIATAIPKIALEFNALEDVGWYGSSYLVTTTALQPSFGKIFQYFDVKWTYLIALIIFELGSVICAVAKTSLVLILGRAIAGIGAAALFSGSMTILGYVVPLHKRAIYIACMSSMFGIASVVGPILGGTLTDNLSWRWCFWINLPFGAVAFVCVFIFFQNPPLAYQSMPFKEKIGRMDLVGASFFIAAICSLLLSLQWGGISYPWSDTRVWGCMLSFGLLIIIFCVIQWKLGDKATMPPRILCGQRTVAVSAIFTAFFAMALYTHIYYLPFYFQAVKGTTAEQSGIRCIPYLISITVGSIIAGGFITLTGMYNPPLWLGTAVFAVGSGLIYTLKVESGPAEWIGFQVVTGVGVGCIVQIPFIAMQAVLSEADMPIGNAVAVFFNTFGGAIALSISQNIFTNTLYTKAIPKYGLSLMSYNEAVTSTFLVPIIVVSLAFLASFFFPWKNVKGQNLLAAVG